MASSVEFMDIFREMQLISETGFMSRWPTLSDQYVQVRLVCVLRRWPTKQASDFPKDSSLPRFHFLAPFDIKMKNPARHYFSQIVYQMLFGKTKYD
jgi:hypothetical protein